MTNIAITYQDIDRYVETHGYRKAIRKLEKLMIDNALIKTHGNQTAAANMLGISRTTLRTVLNECKDV